MAGERSSTTDNAVLDQVVQAAHHHLALDAVYISRLTASEEIYEAVAGDAASFGIRVGGSCVRTATLCHGVVSADLPSLIADVAADPRARPLVEANVALGAYLGVPLLHSDGSVYGIVCGISHAPDPTLDDRDVRFMSLLAELLVPRLDQRREREDLTHAIIDVISERKLTVAAQPVIDLRDGHCLGIEALSRFRAPFGRPDKAFADAASVGLGVELEALAVQRAWDLLPELAPDQFLSLNLSPAAATELSVRAHDRPDLPLSQLVIEVTEHAAVDSYTDLRNRFRPLREAGLRMAVDDAGAGYASLRHVVELRPDFVKIDRDLVHGLADDHARRVAVSAFVLLALDLGATVIAEGLERPQDLRALNDLGVDAAQGYLYGKPTSSRRTIRTWLNTQHPTVAPTERQEQTANGHPSLPV